MNKNKELINEFLNRVCSFSNTDEEDEIAILEEIVDFIIALGGLSASLKSLLKDNKLCDYSSINFLLLNIDEVKMKPIYATAFLRYTYWMRENLSEWKNTRDRILNFYKKNNLDYNELFGLLD